MRKGIILAGGAGTRLHPLTRVVSKQLLPVYDKPMIFFPLSTLMLAGIREVLIISTPVDLPNFERLLGDGSDLGMKFTYQVQEVPNGLAQAFVLGRDFLGEDDVCLVLGDNIFYGVELPHDVVKIAAALKPSARGEYEITDVNKAYLAEGRLRVKLMSRGFAWLDTGTHQSLADATSFVRAIEERQGLQMSCIEEIAWHKGWIDDHQLQKLADAYGKSTYGIYLRNLVG